MGVEVAGQQVQAAPGEWLKDSTKIQGNILAPFNKPHQAFLFLNFNNDQAAAQGWLTDLAGRVATTQDVVAHNAAFKAWRDGHRSEPPEKTQWRGVGLTSWGLVTLHPELAADLAAHDAFWRGPLAEGTDAQGNRIAPAAVLGDEQQSDPRSWVVGGPDQPPVDALVTIAADNQKDLLAAAQDEVDEAEGRGLTVVGSRLRHGEPSAAQLGATLQGENGGVEHFGFKDGVSQPGIRGFTKARLRDGCWENEGKPGSPIIATGEFVLGYPGERGSYLRGRRPDPPEWMRDGSFQVFLRLTQDVTAWLEELALLGAALSEDPDDVAAKVIGRRKDGTPLAPEGGGRELNSFNYRDDPLGNHTPRWAHIRRLNPRHDDVYNDRSHRLLRRGIPFGPLANNLAEAQRHPTERGLLLNAFMASIDDQFEVVQRHWASNADVLPVLPGRGGPESAVTDGPDPLIGASTHPCFLRRDGQDPVPLYLPRFVRTTGAVYAFAPSIPTLQRLGSEERMRV
jgi:Dyp-type peroxidase family